MYSPQSFSLDEISAQSELISRYPLGLLISNTPQGIEANPLPFLVDVDTHGVMTLRAHFSKANTHWQSLCDNPECLVVFQGEQGYISPSWYASKVPSGGKVVPTWNYATVQVSATAKIIDDPQWLRTLLERLTHLHEGQRPEPWQISDAPDNFIASMLKGIVGIELVAHRVVGKAKLGQNRSAEDVAGAAKGLYESEGQNSPLASAMKKAKDLL
ncbi:FMN-binding negative transcriptional regulator [Rouxiella sp. Mn2063]|uniref:FMN-binding negative transcriptional regulator n=1 Tax=Rouxiella sp. Mn2063 TaxID=3395262 RepID=UPI003BBAFBE9